MRNLVVLLIPGLLAAADLPLHEPIPETDSRVVAAHVARAKEIAGERFDFLAEGFLCRPAENALVHAIRNVPGFLDPNAPGVEPFQAFDNLYYVGLHAIGTWILDTGEGLIVFDSLNSEADVRNVLVPGMLELGLTPSDMKYVIVTHGHFDHYGGASFLKREYAPRIGMSGPDWAYLPEDIARPYAVKTGYPTVIQPERDLVITDGQIISMGNAKVEFLVTPGHTPGTLSSILTVQDQGRDRKVAMWGGQALPWQAEDLALMHDSLHRFWEEGKAQGVEGLVSTHAWVVGNFELRNRGRGVEGNPLFIGTDGFDQVMHIYDECIKAQFARIHARSK